MAEYEVNPGATQDVASDATQDTAQDVNVLKNDLGRLRQDVAALTETLKKVVEEKAEVGRAKAVEELDRLYGQFKEGYESLHKEGRRARTGLEKEIEGRPFTAVLSAFLAGVVFGKFVSPR